MIRFCRSTDSTTERTETPVLSSVQAGIDSTSNGSPLQSGPPLNFFFLCPSPLAAGSLIGRRQLNQSRCLPLSVAIPLVALSDSKNQASPRDLGVRLFYNLAFWFSFVACYYRNSDRKFFFLLVLRFPGASFQCENTCQDLSGCLQIYTAYCTLGFLPSQYFSIDISRGCVIKPKLAAALPLFNSFLSVHIIYIKYRPQTHQEN